MVDNSHCNQSIHCTVTNCKYHNDTKNYCSLNSITVGTHEPNPTNIACTDCESFELKSSCSNC